MTLQVAVVGSGPAGFSIAAALLADAELDVTVDLIDRAALPDGQLRHGPAAGEQRLKDVAQQVDSVLADKRVRYLGSVEVGGSLPLDELRNSFHAVVLASGAPLDLPLAIAGRDSVGVGTLSHVEAWLSGSVDVAVAELDLDMDTAVLFGIASETLRIATVLCGKTPSGVAPAAAERLSHNNLRYVQLIDSRSLSEIGDLGSLPENVVARGALTPVGIVGRNRARAVRCVHRPDLYGRVVTEDLRAQLLLRPRAATSAWQGLDHDGDHIAQVDSRVLSGGRPVTGLYVAGWAGRTPSGTGSHAVDAAAVVSAIRADHAGLPDPAGQVDEVLAARGVVPSASRGWSAVAATDVLLERFAGEGCSPLADYDQLVEQVEDD
jgi:hypothetical protein